MTDINFVSFNSEIGCIFAAESEGAVIAVSINDRDGEKFFRLMKKKYSRHKLNDLTKAPCQLLESVKSQIIDYLRGRRKSFELPLSPSGSYFQKKVWRALLKIKYGQKLTYGEVAGLTGNKNAARAVGGACKRNPIPLIIPCHRVVGSGGALTGFGAGLDVKEKLLRLEEENN